MQSLFDVGYGDEFLGATRAMNEEALAAIVGLTYRSDFVTREEEGALLGHLEHVDWSKNSAPLNRSFNVLSRDSAWPFRTMNPFCTSQLLRLTALRHDWNPWSETIMSVVSSSI